MKKLIFVDTNIYLRFYDKNSSEYKKLLKSLEEAKDVIFVTKQIVDEVNRNKLDVFLTSMNSYIKQFGLNKISLPEHLETEKDEDLKNWNKETKELEERSKKQNDDLKSIITKLIDNISISKDEVSVTLAKIFKSERKHKAEQIKRARERKELGNPPGKKADPIGDQLSWEQLVDEVKMVEEIWIISNDTDFLFEFNKKYYLNPYLYNELVSQNKKIKIHSFNTLSEGLRSFNKSSTEKITTLPKEELLEKIEKEEKISNVHQYWHIKPFSNDTNIRNFEFKNWDSDAFGNTFSLYSRRCSNCQGPLDGPYFRANPDGSIKNEFFCKACHQYSNSL